MATNWYWRDGGQERGPVSFQELALMVQDRLLSATNEVRPSYTTEWQNAGTVVGLFYMSQRLDALLVEDVPTEPISLLKQGSDPLEQASIAGESRLPERVRPLFQQTAVATSDEYLLEMAAEDVQAALDLPDSIEEEVEVPNVSGDIRSTIKSAAQTWDRHHTVSPQVERTWLTRVGGSSRQKLAWLFRGGCSLGLSVLTGWLLMSWSQHLTLRYPNHEWIAAHQTVFPLFGPCSPMEYTVLLADVVLMSAIAGYFGARGLESLTDD